MFLNLSHDYSDQLVKFYRTLDDKEKSYFKPHEFDDQSIHKIIDEKKIDQYILMLESGSVIGYGLLRGWDKGYSIPSLGIAIHRAYRGVGYGSRLMNHLSDLALHNGASKIRLRVHRENSKAISFYANLGYFFLPLEPMSSETHLIGFLDISS